MSFQTCMILKNVGNQTVLVTIDLHCMNKKKNTDISQNIFSVSQKKVRFGMTWRSVNGTDKI